MLACIDAAGDRRWVGDENGGEPDAVLDDQDVGRSPGDPVEGEIGTGPADEVGEAVPVADLGSPVDLRVLVVDGGERPEMQPERKVVGPEELGIGDATQCEAELVDRRQAGFGGNQASILVADPAQTRR